MSEELVPYKTEPIHIAIEDVRKFIAPNATEKELFMFMGICKSYGLNPFKREIHFVKYGTSAANIIVGYENYLKRAERTGKLDGWKCWIEKDEIGEKAVIEIKRKDQSLPVRWEVYRKEFDKQQSTWKAMPTFMLKKVAIAQGFRLAFPDDLGGMPYIPEELPTTKDATSETLPADVVEVAAPLFADTAATPTIPEPQDDVPDFSPPGQPGKPLTITDAQKSTLTKLMRDKGMSNATMKDFYEYVLELDRSAIRAQGFIDRFDEYHEQYNMMKEQQTKEG